MVRKRRICLQSSQVYGHPVATRWKRFRHTRCPLKPNIALVTRCVRRKLEVARDFHPRTGTREKPSSTVYGIVRVLNELIENKFSLTDFERTRT